MCIIRIHSKYILQELFSFISEKRKFKLIKYCNSLKKKLNFSIDDFLKFYVKNKIEKYDFIYVSNYLEKFKNDFNDIINKKDLIINGISRNINFDLKLVDDNFNIIINDSYFENNVRINLDDLFFFNIPRMIIIKNHRFTEKALKTFKDIFLSFSSYEEMNKNQLQTFFIEFLPENNIITELEINDWMLKYDSNRDGKLTFQDFIKLIYEELILLQPKIIWRSLYKLGYNNLLDKKKEIDFDYLINNINKFEECNKYIICNFGQISKKNIYKLSLFKNIHDDYIKYLIKNQKFNNLKILSTSVSLLNQMIKLKVICPNIEELNLEICDIDFAYNKNDLNILFPKMKKLSLYIRKKFDLFDLMRRLKDSDSQLNTLIIFVFDKYDNVTVYSNIKSKIIFETIKNLEIYIVDECNINDLMHQFFNNIQFPYLTKYILNFDFTQINQNIDLNESDYNIINKYFINDLNNKDNFSLKSFFNLPNQLKTIRYLKLKSNIFSYIYEKKRNEKNYFKFNLHNKNMLKQYYSNIDFSICDKEVIKYKKIDIKGILEDNDINIEEIIEKKDINLCEINLNFNQSKYYIKSFEKLRSIYSENENQSINLLNILNKNNKFDNVKYINLTLGYIKESPFDKSTNNMYQILSKIISKSKNLKSLVLRLNPHNFIENINFVFQLIENLKKLRVLNISQIIEFPKYNFSLDKILERFPKLKERKQLFNEFKIGNEGFVLKKKRNIYFNFNKYVECTVGVQNHNIRKSIDFFKNNQLQNSISEKNYSESYKFPKSGKNLFKMRLQAINYLGFSHCICEEKINLKTLNI